MSEEIVEEENIIEVPDVKPLPMTPEEVIARIRAARAREEAPRACGNGGCAGCKCGKNNA